METACSLPCSQQPATRLYCDPDEPNTFPYNLCNYHFNVILQSTTRSSSCLFPSGFPIKTSTHHLLLDLINWRIFGKGRKSRSFSLCPLLRFHISSPLLDWNIFLFSSTVSLCFCLNTKNHVSHPHITTNSIKLLYILMYKCKLKINIVWESL